MDSKLIEKIAREARQDLGLSSRQARIGFAIAVGQRVCAKMQEAVCSQCGETRHTTLVDHPIDWDWVARAEYERKRGL